MEDSGRFSNRVVTLATLFVVLLLSHHARADFTEDIRAGMEAANRGNYLRAERLLKPAVDEGEPSAQALLGSIYISSGRSVAGLDLLRQASAAGHQAAKEELAFHLYYGRITRRDEDQAWDLLEGLTSYHFPASMYILGELKLRVLEDRDSAFPLLYEAALADIYPAKILLASALSGEKQDVTDRYGTSEHWLHSLRNTLSPIDAQLLLEDIILADENEVEINSLDILLELGANAVGPVLEQSQNKNPSVDGEQLRISPLQIAVFKGRVKWVKAILNIDQASTNRSICEVLNQDSDEVLFFEKEDIGRDVEYIDTPIVEVLLQRLNSRCLIPTSSMTWVEGCGFVSDDEICRRTSLRKPDSWSVFHALIASGISEKIELAISYYEDIVDERLQSALMYALDRNPDDHQLVGALLNAGANPNLVSDKGSLALDFSGNRKVEELLREASHERGCSNVPPKALCATNWGDSLGFPNNTLTDQILSSQSVLPTLSPQLSGDSAHAAFYRSGLDILVTAHFNAPSTNTIRLWDVNSRQVVREFAMQGSIDHVAVSKDKTTVTAHSRFGAVTWNLETGEQAWSTPKRARVYSSPSGAFVVYEAGNSRRLHIRDLSTNEEVKIALPRGLSRSRSYAIADSGEYIVVADGRGLSLYSNQADLLHKTDYPVNTLRDGPLMVSRDGAYVVFEESGGSTIIWQPGENVHRRVNLPPRRFNENKAAFSPDGTYVYTVRQNLAFIVASASGDVILEKYLSRANGVGEEGIAELKTTLSLLAGTVKGAPNVRVEISEQHSFFRYSVDFEPWKPFVYENGDTVLFDKTSRGVTEKIYFDYRGSLTELPGGDALNITKKEYLRELTLVSGELDPVWKKTETTPYAHYDSSVQVIDDKILSERPDGKLVIDSNIDQIVFGGSINATSSDHTSFAADSSLERLYSSKDGDIIGWNLAKSAEMWRLSNENYYYSDEIALVPDERYLLRAVTPLVNANESTALSILDPESGETIREIPGTSAALSANGSSALIVHSNSINVYTVFSDFRQAALTIPLPDTSQEPGRPEEWVYGQVPGDLLTISSSSDARYGVIHTKDGAFVWDLRSAELVRRLDTSPPKDEFFLGTVASTHSFNAPAAFISQDGERVYVATDTWFRATDTLTGKLVQELSGNDLAWSDTAIRISIDGNVFFLDINTGEIIRRLQNNQRLTASPNFRLFQSRNILAYESRYISFIDLQTAEPLGSYLQYKSRDRSGNWIWADARGFFDASNLDNLDASWVIPRLPLQSVPIDVFFRDFYVPGMSLNGFNKASGVNQKSIDERNVHTPLVELDIISVSAEKVRLRVTATSSSQTEGAKSVHDLRVFANGLLVKIVDAQGDQGHATTPKLSETLEEWRERTRIDVEGEFEAEIEIGFEPGKGAIEYSAYAFNEDRVRGKEYSITAELPELQKRLPSAWIAVVGVNDNRNPSMQLSFAVPSAQKFGDSLRKRLSTSGKFESINIIPVITESRYQRVQRREDGLPPAIPPLKRYVRSLLAVLSGDTDSVDEDFIRRFPMWVRSASPGDSVYIYFAGHGTTEDGEFGLVPYDSIPMGNNPGLRNVITSPEISAWLTNLYVNELFVIVDACHSAGVVDQAGFRPGPLGDPGLGQLAYDKGITVLASSQTTQEVEAFGLTPLSRSLNLIFETHRESTFLDMLNAAVEEQTSQEVNVSSLPKLFRFQRPSLGEKSARVY